jgi:cytochrome b561
MALFYLLLAAFLAITLNGGNRFVRALATAVAALSLLLMVSSIFLADFDGTFANRQRSGAIFDDVKPLILNIQAAVGTVGILVLLWATWRQVGRVNVAPLAVLNSGSSFGRVSRYAHWTVAILILALIPMGMFMSILPAESSDRDSFVTAHQTMGVLVLILVAVRLAWLLRSPAPGFGTDLKVWERRLAHFVHIGLYALILAFPITGLFMTYYRDEGWSAGLAILHDRVLPLLFYGIIAMHVGAVIKHHFVDRRIDDVRRMLR